MPRASSTVKAATDFSDTDARIRSKIMACTRHHAGLMRCVLINETQEINDSSER